MKLATGCAVLMAATLWGQAGHWEGAVKRDSGDIRISLDLAMNARSQWIASMGAPPNMKGLVVMDLAVEGKSVKLTAVELMMTKFEMTLNEDGVLKGTCTSRQGNAMPVELKRTGEAQVELIEPSPAVSKEMEGVWEGTMDAGGRTIHMIFRFKNQPDKMVKATVDTVETQAMGLPLDNVKQAERKIEFGMRVARARFVGTLNAEGSEISGEFRRENGSVPLTLKKK